MDYLCEKFYIHKKRPNMANFHGFLSLYPRPGLTNSLTWLQISSKIKISGLVMKAFMHRLPFLSCRKCYF